MSTNIGIYGNNPGIPSDGTPGKPAVNQNPPNGTSLNTKKVREQLNRPPTETQSTRVLGMLSMAGSSMLRALKCTGIVLGCAILGLIGGAVFGGGTVGLTTGFSPPGVLLGAAIGGIIGLAAGIAGGMHVAKEEWRNT